MPDRVYGFGMPEILAGMQRERNLRLTIATRRAAILRGYSIDSNDEWLDRSNRAHAYDKAATIRMMQPNFRLGEVWDRILQAVGL
jgi:hypothetical protein